MEYVWPFMNEGIKRVEEEGRSVRAYVASLNPPELGPMVWQQDPESCGFPADIKDAAEAIAALAASVYPDMEGGGFAVLHTIIDLADWIKARQ